MGQFLARLISYSLTFKCQGSTAVVLLLNFCNVIDCYFFELHFMASVFHLLLILNTNKLSIISFKFTEMGDSEELHLSCFIKLFCGCVNVTSNVKAVDFFCLDWCEIEEIGFKNDIVQSYPPVSHASHLFLSGKTKQITLPLSPLDTSTKPQVIFPDSKQMLGKLKESGIEVQVKRVLFFSFF